MNVFFCRKPYIVEVATDPLQIATKIELFIWKLGTTEPTTPTNVIEKLVYAPAQYIGKYNISPFVSTYIKGGEAYYVKVKKYYKLTDTWIFNATEENIALYGYSVPQSTGYLVLQSSYDERYVYSDSVLAYPSNTQSLQILFDFDLYAGLRVEYISDLGNEIVDYSTSGTLYVSIPMSLNNDYFKEYNDVKVSYFDGVNYTQFYEGKVINVCESKFNPYILSYTNIYGGISKIYLFKKSTLSDEYTDSTYNLEGEKQVFNLNGVQSFKLNTGWLRESDVNAVKEMMLSEDKELRDLYGNIITNVVIKTKSITEKTSLNDRNINYEFEFESSSPIIQDYV